MSNIVEVLMERDGLTKSEAKQRLQDARDEFYTMMADGCGYDEVEDLLLDDFGLEMDYFMDLL